MILENVRCWKMAADIFVCGLKIRELVILSCIQTQQKCSFAAQFFHLPQGLQWDFAYTIICAMSICRHYAQNWEYFPLV